MKFASKLNMNLKQVIFLSVKERPAGISVAPRSMENLLKAWLQLSCPLIQAPKELPPEGLVNRTTDSVVLTMADAHLPVSSLQGSIRNLLCWDTSVSEVLDLTTKHSNTVLPGDGGQGTSQLEMELMRLLDHLQGRWQSHLLQTY